jgi:hypothetical protein
MMDLKPIMAFAQRHFCNDGFLRVWRAPSWTGITAVEAKEKTSSHEHEPRRSPLWVGPGETCGHTFNFPGRHPGASDFIVQLQRAVILAKGKAPQFWTEGADKGAEVVRIILQAGHWTLGASK